MAIVKFVPSFKHFTNDTNNKTINSSLLTKLFDIFERQIKLKKIVKIFKNLFYLSFYVFSKKEKIVNTITTFSEYIFDCLKITNELSNNKVK